MRKFWLAGGAIACAALIGIAGEMFQRHHATAAEKPVDRVLRFTRSEVVQPVLGSMPERIEFSGVLTAPRTAVVRAKAAGTLLTLSVAEGNRVKAGQSLGTIDLADLESREAERTALVDSARARVAEAERLYQSNLGLAEQKFISTNALENSRTRLEAARAELRSSEAQLASSRLGIREAALVAPISGLVGKRSALPGEKVSAEQELLTVIDLSVLELSGIVGTNEVSRLSPGEPLTVDVEGASELVRGRIDRISPTVEPGTGGIRVIVVIPNPRERFRAGQYASAVVERADPVQRLSLPASAIGQASGQEFVWTIERGVLVRRLILTGRHDAARRVEIVQGLSPGAQVLAARFDGLLEGAAAQVDGSAASAASASN